MLVRQRKHTDFVEERRQLLETVGPDLHSQLDALGIEVEMADIHYGTGYDSAFDVDILKCHLSEIDHCFQISRGCFFMVGRHDFVQPAIV
ncbi:hypothetical protein RUM43_011293 [Polyplax serrata]|uniref:Uncharacterized protein n=1 Tax=Polyplax serrata TaxID=468196 RepID=A0AAN8NY38_POLSC